MSSSSSPIVLNPKRRRHPNAPKPTKSIMPKHPVVPSAKLNGDNEYMLLTTIEDLSANPSFAPFVEAPHGSPENSASNGVDASLNMGLATIRAKLLARRYKNVMAVNQDVYMIAKHAQDCPLCHYPAASVAAAKNLVHEFRKAVEAGVRIDVKEAKVKEWKKQKQGSLRTVYLGAALAGTALLYFIVAARITALLHWIGESSAAHAHHGD